MDQINIKDLSISQGIKNFYLMSGIEKLHPPQSDAIRGGLLEGTNTVISIPTAAGKTLLAELAILKRVVEAKNPTKALYIVPLKALATEKYNRFKEFENIAKQDGHGVSVALASGDLDTHVKEDLMKYDILIATSEKVDSMMRGPNNFIDQVSIVVADEVHLVDSENRGPTLELILMKLLQRNVQIIALSATIGNPQDIARWLRANLITSDWRPIKLKEGIMYHDVLAFNDGNSTNIEKKHNDYVISLIIDTIGKNGQALVFESSRRNAESSATKTATAISYLIEGNIKERLKSLSKECLDLSDSQASKRLSKCLENGTAFHHAGLSPDHRKIVEKGYKDNIIKVISSTPTLAAGLNLPARQAIIKSTRRYIASVGQVPIPVLEYKQMAGRAGRPGLDPYGESVLVAKSEEEYRDLVSRYIQGKPEKIWSKLGYKNKLMTHILSIIASGYADSEKGIGTFMEYSLYAKQQAEGSLNGIIRGILIDLLNEGMITVSNEYVSPTELGKVVSRLYIDPTTASKMLKGMNRIRDSEMEATDTTFLHLISGTQDMYKSYLRTSEYKTLSEYVLAHHSEYIEIPAFNEQEKYEEFLIDVKTTLIMSDWINEIREDILTESHNIGEGDLRVVTENALWLIHSMKEIARVLKLPFEPELKALEKRMRYGARMELLELLQIRGIGRVRARKLYSNGIQTLVQLQGNGISKTAELIGPKIAKKVFRQINVSVVHKETIMEQSRLC